MKQGCRTVQIVVPKVDKAKGDIDPHEYEITAISLGPTTKKREAKDLDNSIASMKARVDKEVDKKKEYKKEVECLRESIQHLTRPLNQANPEAPLLLNPQETVKSSEEKAITTRDTKAWMESTSKETDTFVERLALTYGQTSSLLSRIANMAEAWANLQDIQERIIPCLRVLKGMSKQELIDAGVAYAFSSWH